MLESHNFLKFKAFGWRRVGSIKQSDHSSLALAHERLTTKLELGGVQVVYTASLSGESNDQAIEAELDELKVCLFFILF